MVSVPNRDLDLCLSPRDAETELGSFFVHCCESGAEAFLLVNEQGEVITIINIRLFVNVCWPTWMPTLRLTCSMMKSIARQIRAGAKTHPCLTPEVVMNGVERRPAKCTLADVAVCRSIIRSMSTEEHRYHAWPSRARFCLLNQMPPSSPQMRHAVAVGILWISVNRCNARIASSVERQRVNPDW